MSDEALDRIASSPLAAQLRGWINGRFRRRSPSSVEFVFGDLGAREEVLLEFGPLVTIEQDWRAARGYRDQIIREKYSVVLLKAEELDHAMLSPDQSASEDDLYSEQAATRDFRTCLVETASFVEQERARLPTKAISKWELYLQTLRDMYEDSKEASTVWESFYSELRTGNLGYGGGWGINLEVAEYGFPTENTLDWFMKALRYAVAAYDLTRAGEPVVSQVTVDLLNAAEPEEQTEPNPEPNLERTAKSELSAELTTVTPVATGSQGQSALTAASASGENGQAKLSDKSVGRSRDRVERLEDANPSDVAKVRAAMDDHSKSDLIVAACKGMRKQRVLDIRRLLLREKAERNVPEDATLGDGT